MELEDRDPPGARALARVDPQWDASRVERTLSGLHRRRARRRALTVLGAVLLVLTVVTGAVELTPASEAPIASTANVDDRVVQLADGSRVSPDEGAQIVVEGVTSSRIEVRVARGSAEVEVVPGLPRRFEVSVASVTVTVIGTSFRVERIDDVHARVSVHHGHVDVSWPGGHADLIAGDDGVFPSPETDHVVSVLPSEPTIASAPSPTTLVAHERMPSVARAEPTWRELARASRFDEAYAALGPASEQSRVVGDRVDDLLLAADAARLSGHRAEALPWLRTIERDHADDPRAAIAAFTCGNVLHDLGRAAEAAEEFEHALAMDPEGSQAQGALAHAAENENAAGHADRARELARRYLGAYPGGRWSRRMEAIVPAGE